MARQRKHTEGNAPTVMESKADRFRRLANKRLANAVKALRNLARLGNRKQYEYTDEQHAMVNQVIRECVERLHRAFSEPETSSNGEANYF